MQSIDYNARGQRVSIGYYEDTFGGSDPSFDTTYEYDPLTYRLTRLTTQRASDSKVLQDWSYTYDAAGNLVQISDGAQDTLYFDNASVDATTKYVYDALYRLVSAEGRERSGLGQSDPSEPTMGGLPESGAPVTYLQTYVYDEVGNLLEMKHQGGTEASPGAVRWHRYYEVATGSNRLLSTSQPSDTAAPYSDGYTYNVRGAMTEMPHLQGLIRDWRDHVRVVELNLAGDEAVYHYDSGGQRVRKVVRRGRQHRGAVVPRRLRALPQVHRREHHPGHGARDAARDGRRPGGWRWWRRSRGMGAWSRCRPLPCSGTSWAITWTV